jgi:putative salt-induced outer membrane protein YdiY
MLFSFCFFLPSVFPAESNDEFEEVDSTSVSGERKLALLELSLTSTTGNSEALSLFTGTELFYESSGNSIGFDGNFYYGEKSQALNTKVLEARLTGAHDFNLKNYAYILGTLKHDDFEKLNLRSTIGIGYGYRLIKNPYGELSLEGGVGLQDEDFNVERKDDYYHEGRIGINYTYRFSKTARFVTKDEYLPALSGISNYRIRGEFKLIESIYRNLAVILHLILDYDGSPVERNIKEMDTRLFAGIGYNFF